jgi:hypothetical protein
VTRSVKQTSVKDNCHDQQLILITQDKTRKWASLDSITILNVFVVAAVTEQYDN